MIRLVIIDDEPAVRNTIVNMVEYYCPNVQIVGQAGNVKKGVSLLAQLQPELLFLDIKMRDGTGFDLLERTYLKKTRVVFVSAYDEFALKAFKYSAFDFILKPIDPAELMGTIAKTEEYFGKEQFNSVLNQFADHINKSRKVMVRTENDIHFINSGDLIRCQSDGNYTRFYLSNGSSLIASKTLKSYDELLHPCGFFRVHKSHLVNLEHVVRFDKSCGGILYFRDRSCVPVASRKKEELMRVLETY